MAYKVTRLRVCIHIISVVIFVKTLYSDSVLDLETVICFHALRVMRFAHGYTANPPDHPGSLSNLKALTNTKLDLYILIPSLVHALRYCSICFKCIIIGECKN
jgi:hypothetical protein